MKYTIKPPLVLFVRYLSIVCIVFVGLVQSVPGHAQEKLPGLESPVKGAGEKLGGLIDGRTGFGQVDEDWFISLNIGTALQWGKLGIGVQVPLRFRVSDAEPKNDGVLRKEDWDEVSDWTRVLRFVTWGQPTDNIYGRIGVLSGSTIGHGTIVDRYYNVIDADHYQTGIDVKVDMEIAGGRLLLDNLMDPAILAVRAFIRPLQFFDLGGIFKRFTVGLTLVGDFAAPNKPKLDDTGRRIVDEDGVLETDISTATLLGIDLGWEVLKTNTVALTPYFDLNVLLPTSGYGLHTGILTSFKLGSAVTLGARVEYRAVTADYEPNYVNSWYEVERVDFRDSKKPKIRYLLDQSDAGIDSLKHGWHGSLDMTFFGAVTITGILEDYQGKDNANLMVRLLLPWMWDSARLSVYYAKRNFDSFSDAFDLDRGMLVAEAKYKIGGPMFAFAQYSREWRLDKDPDSSNYGHYETINDYDFGIGAEFTF